MEDPILVKYTTAATPNTKSSITPNKGPMLDLSQDNGVDMLFSRCEQKVWSYAEPIFSFFFFSLQRRSIPYGRLGIKSIQAEAQALHSSSLHFSSFFFISVSSQWPLLAISKCLELTRIARHFYLPRLSSEDN